jgi:hypothetical protein
MTAQSRTGGSQDLERYEPSGTAAFGPPVLTQELTARALTLRTHPELLDWLRDVEKEFNGVSWRAVGDEADNVHTVEVSTDPALAMLERVTNGIDALLDLRARELDQTAVTPHEAAQKWWGIPLGGPGRMREDERFELGGRVRVTMEESGEDDRPTVVIQDQGTGQHPDDFPHTLMSLHRSNKKTKMHQMGQYNAGGSASYKFAGGTVVMSRLAPALSSARSLEAGITVVRYNPLDPDKFKSGTYEYMVAKDGSVIRLASPELPELGFGTIIRLVSYLLPKYAKAAFGPKNSLWHLLHAALPEPALPVRIVETRHGRFRGMKREIENRTVLGLRHLLSRSGTSIYAEERTVRLGESGSVVLRYFVLSDDTEPDAYVTSDHALALTMNGQRQGAKDRAWLQRRLELNFLGKRLIVLVDATGLTNAAKRQVFASTREHGVDTPLSNTILDRVIEELRSDDGLYELEALAKQRALNSATRTTTEKVKRQLAGQVAAMLKGQFQGKKGGQEPPKPPPREPPRTPRPPRPPQTDDSQMLEIPDKLLILNSPVKVRAGGSASLRLEINAKNDFLPTHAVQLQVVLGSELKDYVSVGSTGRLLGGRVRVQLRASAAAPESSAGLTVALMIPELGVALTDAGRVEIVPRDEERVEDGGEGGEPNVEINWVRRDAWERLGYTEHSVGTCIILREDPNDREAITKVEWVLNEAFVSYERVAAEKRRSEASLRLCRERYEMPIALALFRQLLAEESKEREADEEGHRFIIPDDYVEAEKERVANAVLMAIEPEFRLAEAMT